MLYRLNIQHADCHVHIDSLALSMKYITTTAFLSYSLVADSRGGLQPIYCATLMYELQPAAQRTKHSSGNVQRPNDR
jgi:hypothetical protein